MSLSSSWSRFVSSISSSAGKSSRRRQALRRGGRQIERLEVREQMAADIIVAPSGDDWGAGTLSQPFQTIRRALDAAQPGDTITLRNGVYEGGINIDIDNLTIRSMPGEWAVIESPLTQQTDGRGNSVIRYNYDVQGGRLENLEIAGGYWYGVMMWDWWDPTWGPESTHVGASGITLEGLKIHDTGVDGVKITPGANDISIVHSEIYNTGRRAPQSADGIDNNNGDRMIARGNYIHDTASIGILTSGGAVDALIEQNFVQDTAGAGIVVGFYSEAEWMEPATNPEYFTSINAIARNNIIVDAGQAGIGIYASQNAQVVHNTIVNAAADAQAPLQFAGIELWLSDADPYHHVASAGLLVANNLITTASDNDTRMVDIREGSYTGQLNLDHNLYFGTNNRGILFIDRNLTGDGTPEQTFSQWKANYGYDAHSLLADPQLDASWHLTAASPAIGRAIPLANLATDFDSQPRAADPPAEADPPGEVDPPEPDFGAIDPPEPDLGADEFQAGTSRVLPPAPFGAPSLEIAARGYHDGEGQTIQVRVLRHGSAADTVTVQFATLDGSARAGLDYVASAGTLVFAPGETEKLVSVTLLADSAAEGDEHLLFTLSNPTTDGDFPVRLGHQAAASVTLDDAQTPLTLHYATKWVASDGSDVTGDGSEAHPWKSLQFAADNVGPGDFVIVKPGRYWGMNMTTDGKPDARITFHAMPGVLVDEPNPQNRLDGINLEGADYVTIEGFEVVGMPRAGLRSVNNDGAIFRGNRSDDNTMWGMLTGWSENIVVENNVMSRSHVEHGIYISNSSDGAIIRNNIVFGNNDSGIQFNGDGSLAGDGIHSHNLIEGNIVYDNGRGGGAALNFDGLQDSIVRNNLLYDNHATGIVLYVGFAADSSTNNLIQNNTVVMAEDARWALLMTDGSSGNSIVNNILLNKNPNRGSMTVEQNSLPATSDHNFLQNYFQLDGYGGSFAGWQAFSGGQDSHSLVVPQSGVAAAIASLFVDAGAGNFQLRSNSPAIDAGDVLQGSSVDLYQHSRPSGNGTDIGAFEAGQFVANVQFEWQDYIGYEAIGMAEIFVTRSGDTSTPLAVEIQSFSQTAASDDYRGVHGYLVFQPGETRKSFRLFVDNDSRIEELETVRLDLRVVGDPTGMIPTDQVGDPTGLIPTDQVGDPTGLIPTDQATLHLVSDDAWRPGQFGFATSSVTFNEATGMAVVTVERSGGSDGEVSLHYSTDLFTRPRQATWIKRHTELLYPTDRDTPATAGEDYQPVAGWLNFAAGETSKTISIPLTDDLWFESGEAFVVKLDSPSGGASLGSQSQLKVRIESDDVKQPGTFVFSTANYEVTEGQGSVNVTIARVGGGNVEASVRLYHTGAGNGSTTNSAWWPSDYGSLPETLTFAAGEMFKTISIPILDDSSTEIDEVFSIQLHSASNDATIGNIPLTKVTIHDNESTFYFRGATSAAWSFEAVEGTGKMPITVVRQGALSSPASVTISTGDSNSAKPGIDFSPIQLTLQFAPGESSKTIEVPLTNDSLMESKESFPVMMSAAVGAEQGSWTWSAAIVDDDVAASPGSLGFAAAGYQVDEAAGMVYLTILRTGGSQGTVTVQYRTKDGATGATSDLTAYAGADYTSKTGTVTFAPGETSQVIGIPIKNDSSIEKNELFTVELYSAAGGASLGTAKAIVTIGEDDSAIEFGSFASSVSEGSGSVAIKLIRKGSTKGAASIDLNISGGATAGKDYVKPLTPTVAFADGEAEKIVYLQLIDDVMAESDEWLYLSLTNAIGSKLGSSLWGNVKITDNDV